MFLLFFCFRIHYRIFTAHFVSFFINMQFITEKNNICNLRKVRTILRFLHNVKQNDGK